MAAGSQILSILVLALVFSSCAHTTAPDVPPEPAPQPIALGPEGSHPIAFSGVVAHIPTGTLLGFARMGTKVIQEFRWSDTTVRFEDFNVAVSNELRRWGYTVIDATDTVFDPASMQKVRYQLAGILRRVEVDFRYRRERSGYLITTGEGEGTAEVEMEIGLYDAVERENVFRKTFTGTGRDTGRQPDPTGPAIVDAISKALADREFVELVAVESRDAAPSTVTPPPTIRLERCELERSLRLPDDMEDVLDAVVIVQVGGYVGSSVIVSDDGYVLTAAHVVSGRDEVIAKLNSGPEIPASVERRDGARDVALLKLPGRRYSCATLVEDSANVLVGTEIFAINAILGEEMSATVSRGVVSGYHEVDGRHFIQTDASVNPGSSGGPIFDRNGAVCGIVVEKIVGVELEGLGFGAPIGEAEQSLGISWD